jgi:hypothetical protein
VPRREPHGRPEIGGDVLVGWVIVIIIVLAVIGLIAVLRAIF